jgi:hypothetical protein
LATNIPFSIDGNAGFLTSLIASTFIPRMTNSLGYRFVVVITIETFTKDLHQAMLHDNLSGSAFLYRRIYSAVIYNLDQAVNMLCGKSLLPRAPELASDNPTHTPQCHNSNPRWIRIAIRSSLAARIWAGVHPLQAQSRK